MDQLNNQDLDLQSGMLVKGLYLYGAVNDMFTDIIRLLLGAPFAMRLDINNRVSVIHRLIVNSING